MQAFQLCRSIYRTAATCVCRLFGCRHEPQDEDERVQRWALYAVLLILVGVIAVATIIIAAYAADQSPFWRWAIAIGYVIVVGHVGGSIFICALRDCYMNLSDDDPDRSVPPGFPRTSTRGVPPGFMGVFERLLFTVVIGFFSINEGVFALMGFWLGAKLLSGWNRAPYAALDGQKMSNWLSRGAMAALLSGVVSLAFAVVDGLIASGHLTGRSICEFLPRSTCDL